MDTYYFPRDCKLLEMLHASMMEEVKVQTVGIMDIYKKEFNGFEYKVVYPGEFEFIQRIHSGQVTPETISTVKL